VSKELDELIEMARTIRMTPEQAHGGGGIGEREVSGRSAFGRAGGFTVP
jgi:hypothetical protein